MKIYVHTDLGTEKRCTRCHEYWPLDEEFFYKNGFKSAVQQWSAQCKACYVVSYRAGYDI
ncbi:hypothetical protein QR674_12570 [Acinetobacter chinensis]|uniref:Zinc-binding domain-containing protein n=1 Tax=Acinetobacter chinensis TaxID=2004650 RepID=A0ABU3WHD4_9GAMM|nr:hypothetical protein [Acinetobacter chinensis]MDV2469814.1 hypothetical protein [Acinetobacter chinensis]